MKQTIETKLSRALAAQAAPDPAALDAVLQGCRARQPRPSATIWDLVRCQLKLLGWQAWALEGFAALALYAIGKELGLWEADWNPRNVLFGLTALAMLTALLGLPFLLKASQHRMLELERATRAGLGRPMAVRFLLLLAGECVLLGVLVVSVRAALPLSTGQLLAVLAVPFLAANNELLLLLRRVGPERLTVAAVPLFAGQLCLLRLVQGPEAELPRFLPLLAGVLAVCMGWQCAKLASRPEWAAEY